MCGAVDCRFILLKRGKRNTSNIHEACNDLHECNVTDMLLRDGGNSQSGANED